MTEVDAIDAALDAAMSLQALRDRAGQQIYHHFFPDETHDLHGITYFARHLYPQHLEFFRAGATYRERCFMAANRVGKTVTNIYETTAHLTGLYPHWWEGRRFERPIKAWAAGKKGETTRDILQGGLFGQVRREGSSKSVSGTGMVPGQMIGEIQGWKPSVANLIDEVQIQHVSGGWSTLGFKSYEQGRGSFEGTAMDLIAIDEECPLDVYGECVIRTATTDGLILLSYTPLDGLTDVTVSFLPEDQRPD